MAGGPVRTEAFVAGSLNPGGSLSGTTPTGKLTVWECIALSPFRLDDESSLTIFTNSLAGPGTSPVLWLKVGRVQDETSTTTGEVIDLTQTYHTYSNLTWRGKLVMPPLSDWFIFGGGAYNVSFVVSGYTLDLP